MALSIASTFVQPWSVATSGRYVAVRRRFGLENRERVEGKDVEEERGEGVLDEEGGEDNVGRADGWGKEI